jgi:hypothetical protein
LGGWGQEVIWIRVGCFEIAKMAVLEDFENSDLIEFYSMFIAS